MSVSSRSGSQKSVLVTGASSGIGKATCLHLARRGYRVVATGRDLSRLRGLGDEAHAESLPVFEYQLDINEPSSVSQVLPQILEQTGRLDALVNNAGYGLSGCLEDLSIEEVRAQFETNVFAVLRMAQAVLPHMREHGGGTIANIGSVVGLIGGPGGGAYSASKFALRGLTNVLRMEVASFGVRVVLIEPGLFRTNFFENQVFGLRAQQPDSHYYASRQRGGRRRPGGQLWAGDPVKVAKVIDRILRARRTRPRYPVGPDAWLGSLAVRLLPDGVLYYLVRRALGW